MTTFPSGTTEIVYSVCCPDYGEITEKQRNLYKALGFEPPVWIYFCGILGFT
jgi:glutamyl/glutaminyl-tRNA synthetase